MLIPLIRKAFKRLHYPVDIIAQCVRWYLAYSLRLRNLEGTVAKIVALINLAPISTSHHATHERI
ncbi:hypothetical protein CGB73_21845 [Klebsiella sp. 11263]|nr:hypothetical protein [Klebsiella sp. CVUAS 11263]